MVLDKASLSPDREGMGTTVVACLVVGNRALIAHKGDSRAYLQRGNHINMLTTDHNVACDLIRQGRISQEKAGSIPYAHALTRHVGMQQDVDAEVSSHTLEPGDRLLLCSDGLFEGLADREIGHIIACHGDLDACCHDLIDSAVENGSRDDITVILLEAGS